MRDRGWLALVGAIAVGGIGGAVVLSTTGGKWDFQHEQEWVRALLQVGLIAVLGIVTSAVLERFKDALQQRRDKSKLRFDVLTEVSRTYMDVKLVRRKLQQSNKFTSTDVDALNQLQVVLELHENNSGRLFAHKTQLEKYLSSMEKYLNKVANEPTSQQHREFTGDGFKAEFSVPFSQARDLILLEIEA